MGVYINAPFDSELNEKAAAVCSQCMINLSSLHPGFIRYPKSEKCDRPGECSPGKGVSF